MMRGMRSQPCGTPYDPGTDCTVAGVALSGNFPGRTPAALVALSGAGRDAIRAVARDALRAAGSDQANECVAGLPAHLKRLQSEHR